MSDSIEVRLSSPVETDKSTLKAVTIRPPTGRALLSVGAPFTARREHPENVTETIDIARAMRLLALCADVGAATIDAMAAVDVVECIERLRIFLPADKPASVLRTYLDAGRYVRDLDFVFSLNVAELFELCRLLQK